MLFRSKQLRSVAEALESRQDEIADIESHEIGMPRAQTGNFQVGLGIKAFSNAADVLESFEFEVPTPDGLIVREPIGIVGAITPWNFPLNQIGAKVAYALAAGCILVTKDEDFSNFAMFWMRGVFRMSSRNCLARRSSRQSSLKWASCLRKGLGKPPFVHSLLNAVSRSGAGGRRGLEGRFWRISSATLRGCMWQRK